MKHVLFVIVWAFAVAYPIADSQWLFQTELFVWIGFFVVLFCGAMLLDVFRAVIRYCKAWISEVLDR